MKKASQSVNPCFVHTSIRSTTLVAARCAVIQGIMALIYADPAWMIYRSTALPVAAAPYPCHFRQTLC